MFLDDESYPADTRAAVRSELEARFRSVPGIVAVAHSTTPPLSGSSWDSVVSVAGPDAERKAETNRSEVSEDYFRVMEIGPVAGRTFTASDTVSCE